MPTLQPVVEEPLPDDISVWTMSIVDETVISQPGPGRVLNVLYSACGKRVEQLAGRVVVLLVKMRLAEAQARIEALMEAHIVKFVFDEVKGTGWGRFGEYNEAARKLFLKHVNKVEDMQKETWPDELYRVGEFVRARKEVARHHTGLAFSTEEGQELMKACRAILRHIK